MSYSDLYIHRSARVPQFFVAAVLAVLVFGGFLSYTFRPQQSQASAGKVDKHLQVNIMQSQVGIYWQTVKPAVGWIMYGESAGDIARLARDEREVGDSKLSSQHHYVLIRNLKPNTKYYYKIISDNSIVLDPQTGKPFEIITATRNDIGTNIKPAYGQVMLANGQPANGAFVFLLVDNAYPLLTLTKITGEFLIPLQTVTSQVSNNAIILSDSDTVRLKIISDSGESNISANVKSLSPLPQTVLIGSSYTFPVENNVLGVSAAPTRGKELVSQEKGGILFPKDNSFMPVKRPLIKGLADPNSLVSVILTQTQPRKSTPYSLRADASGGWKLTLDRDLLPGEYILDATVQFGGQNVKDKRVFNITKSGQVLGESAVSTPSATIAPTVAVTSSAPSATVQPTYSISATPTPPVTGFNVIPLAIVSAGLVVVGLGVILAF